MTTDSNEFVMQQANEIDRLRLVSLNLKRSCCELLQIVRVQNGNLHDDVNEIQSRASAAIDDAITMRLD